MSLKNGCRSLMEILASWENWTLERSGKEKTCRKRVNGLKESWERE